MSMPDANIYTSSHRDDLPILVPTAQILPAPKTQFKTINSVDGITRRNHPMPTPRMRPRPDAENAEITGLGNLGRYYD